ncbi:MAG: hypothetical protein QF613_00730 [Candidatus Marinimicrobia bacterium]|jgi:HEAT repeat protein|nr:hypothetical protein [Candidatus Neomarinimicrobiota bacterium]MDP6457311.1 hypothetical protein [Candidatus Neomarinimicrobiota bacterium]MDP6592725.1 hypothetical protein [Candidatus Neomarinimicrobiota bacterium]MDP6835787.1 hypothetical protein [Candidatus Neomarinimicrobiota bacterium]MDP6966798.1 hypothetical protein [Candidatus Neomarinimicrobiota bacterium]|tara:strand:+ start:3782 stop:4954 length:1173 start_codon:yes stop_codon:yes gene_type:complete
MMMKHFANTNMRRFATLTLLVVVVLNLTSCSRIKSLLKRGKEEVSPQTVEELRIAYIKGDIEALEELVAIYEDENQTLDIRTAAVKAMGESRHPMALNSLSTAVEEAEALDIDLMLTSIEVLGEFEDDPRAAEALLSSILTVDQKLRDVQSTVFKSLAKVQKQDRIIALLDIYERSHAAYQKSVQMVMNTMAKMGKDDVIPILVFIANDDNLDLKVRNRAIALLSEHKDDPKVVELFVEMLTEPETQVQIRDFALRTMKDVKEEHLILALLETYNLGRDSYYSLLTTLLDALGNFDDPRVKPTLIEIALNPDIQRTIRAKAITNLSNFRDPAVFKEMLPLLEDRDNYKFYPQIIELAHRLGVADEYKVELRRAALVAQEKALEEEQAKIN